MRRPVTVSQVSSVRSPKPFIRASAQRTAAPMPRFGSVCDDKVWRVPKLTSFSTVRFISAPLTGATICLSLPSGDGGSQALAALPMTIKQGNRTSLRIHLSFPGAR
jgi:hypothetical protein